MPADDSELLRAHAHSMARAAAALDQLAQRLSRPRNGYDGGVAALSRRLAGRQA